MAAVMTSATAEPITSSEDDREQAALLRDDAAFNAVPDPELERWIAAIQRQANVACAALALVDGPRQVIRVIGAAAGSPKSVNELTSTVSLADYLLGPSIGQSDEPR
jgi:hypothetical protein